MADKIDTTDFSSLNLWQKLARITGDVGAIQKGGENKEQHYAFIEYAAVAGELRGLFAKYGVIIIPYMQKANKQIRTEVVSKYGAKGAAVLVDMAFVVTNADTPTEKFTVTWTGEAIDYGDKATNKAATSALKYYLMRQFNISDKGDDPDADNPDRGEVAKAVSAPRTSSLPDYATEAQLKEIRELAKEAGIEQPAIDARIKEINTKAEAADSIAKLKALVPGDEPAERKYR